MMNCGLKGIFHRWIIILNKIKTKKNMFTFVIACLTAMTVAHRRGKDKCSKNLEGCTVSDVNFQSIGRIDYDYASYLEIAKWDN